MRDRETQCRLTRSWNSVVLRNHHRRSCINPPLVDAEGSFSRFLKLVGAVVLVFSTLFNVAPLPALSQPHHATILNGSSGLRWIDSVIGPVPRFDAVGERSGFRPLVPSRLQSATPLATPSFSECTDGENLIPNAEFESGDEGWYVNGDVELTTTETHSGTTAMRLGSGEARGYIDQRISSTVPGPTYELSGWGKLSASGETAEIGVQLLDSNGARLTAEEPAPLTFSSTAFVEKSLAFTVSDYVADVYVYVSKDEGSTRFYVDTLSLTVCQAPENLEATPAAPAVITPPQIAVPAEQTATPVAGSEAISASTPTGEDATPAPVGIGPLTEYIDPDVSFSVGYPADWRRLTEDEIRAQLGVADERAVEAALANTRFVVVSPDGLAAISYTRLPRRPEAESLAEIVQAVKEANAALIAGTGEITTESLSLDGLDAVRLSFSAADPTSGAAGERLVRQLVAARDDSTVVLTFILQDDSAAMFEETLREIEESWTWRPQP